MAHQTENQNQNTTPKALRENGCLEKIDLELRRRVTQPFAYSQLFLTYKVDEA